MVGIASRGELSLSTGGLGRGSSGAWAHPYPASSASVVGDDPREMWGSARHRHARNRVSTKPFYHLSKHCVIYINIKLNKRDIQIHGMDRYAR